MHDPTWFILLLCALAFGMGGVCGWFVNPNTLTLLGVFAIGVFSLGFVVGFAISNRVQ